MAACEKCWNDAYLRAYTKHISQAECYREILKERDDNPCSKKDQAGQFWDATKQQDKRNLTSDFYDC